MMFRKIFVLVIFLLFTSFGVRGDSKPTVEGVASKLSCYCGTCPSLVVSRCDCSTADEIKRDIKKMIDEGKTEAQIVQSYVAKYGEKALSTPTKSGFNLVSWLMPFAGFIAGGVLLVVFLRKAKNPSSLAEPSPRKPQSRSAEMEEELYRDKVKEELDKLE